jgi:hypothetical protein
MNGTVSRRVFVGSVAAGIPLVVGGARSSFAQTPATQGHTHPATDGSPDAMFEHAARQLAAIAERVQRRGASAEDARLAAAHLGALAVYGQQSGIDAHAKQAVRDLVRAKGREAVLAQEIDKPRARACLKRFGVNADECWLEPNKADYETRMKALEDLSHAGVTGLFTRLASTFEQLGSTLASRGDGTAHIRLAQDDAAWKAGFCAQLSREIQRLEAEAAIVCGVAWFYIALEAVCAMVTIAVGIQMAVFVAYCH